MNKQSIDFFPFATDFFDDDKIALIEAEFGVKGSYVAIKLLCKIYGSEGYYCRWGEDECLLFARRLGAEFVPGTVKEIVRGLVRRSFFDERVLDSFHVLTSRAIQERYLYSCKRRQVCEIRKDILLADVSPYPNVNIIGENVDISLKNVNSPQQTKLNKDETESISSSRANARGGRKKTSAGPVGQEEEQKLLYVLFFNGNGISDPVCEYKRMVDWNNLSQHPWSEMSSEARASAAGLWKPEKAPKQLPDPFFLNCWKDLYDALESKGCPGYVLKDMLAPGVKFTERENACYLQISERLREQLERCGEVTFPILRTLTHQKPLKYMLNDARNGN